MRRKKLFSLITGIVAISIISCNNQSQTVETNKQIARKYIEYWSKHDSIKLASLNADKFLYQDKAFTSNFTTKGEIISFVHLTAEGIPDLIFEPTKVIASDSMAMIEWIWKGTFTVGWPPEYPGTNKPFKVQGVTVFEIRNGLITRSTDYYDKMTFLKVVGLQ